MTPQHRLAIEIMSECGMSPHEIVASFGAEGMKLPLDEVEAVLRTPGRGQMALNHFITCNGITRTISEWATMTGINRHTIRKRLDQGWSEKEALTIPPKLQRNNRRYA